MKFQQEKEVQIVLQIRTSVMLINLKFFTSKEQPGPSFYIWLNLYPIIDNMLLELKHLILSRMTKQEYLNLIFCNTIKNLIWIRFSNRYEQHS